MKIPYRIAQAISD